MSATQLVCSASCASPFLSLSLSPLARCTGSRSSNAPQDEHALLIAELKAREDILRQQLAGSRRAHPSARPRPRGEDVAAPAGGAASHQEARQERGRQPQAEQQTPSAAREAEESQAQAERAQAARNLMQQLEWAQQERRLRERIVMVHAELRLVASLQLSQSECCPSARLWSLQEGTREV